MRQLTCVLAWTLSATTSIVAQGEAKCCFTNPAYTGVCEVVPRQDETCRTILDYLNSPNSAGKSYCGDTVIRGGWQQTTCQSDVLTQGPTASARVEGRLDREAGGR